MKSLKDPHGVEHPAIQDVLVIDIETDSLNTETATTKFFGAYSYKTHKYYVCHEHEKTSMQSLIDQHRVLVGFNNKDFDHPILENNGIDLSYKVVFDCLRVLYNYDTKRPNREAIIKTPNGELLAAALPNRKLKTIAKTLGFPVEKGDIDYKVFQKSTWTTTEYKEIYRYLLKDVKLTRLLFEYYLDYFDSFKQFVPIENIKKFDYIRSSTGSFAYAALCHLMGLDLEWDDNPGERPENHGGFVMKPAVKEAHGTIIYADYASLYPHIMFMCNLFSPKRGGWDGKPFFTDLNGSYDTEKRGLVEGVLKNIYHQRKQFKKDKNPSELALKIIMNSIYGISGSPVFKNVFNETTSGDCTAIGRRIIQYTKQRFEEGGFTALYGDTDSVFLRVAPQHSRPLTAFRTLSETVVQEILERVPFPESSFTLEIDDVFRHIWFFRKKHYVGINQDGKLVIKGLPIIKHDATRLGVKVFEVLKPLILERGSIKFAKPFIESLVQRFINEDVTLAGRVYNVKSPDKYANTTSIQAQVAAVHGEGSHVLVPNSKVGAVGKGWCYCTPEEASTLEVSDLHLDKTWKELEAFIS